MHLFNGKLDILNQYWTWSKTSDPFVAQVMCPRPGPCLTVGLINHEPQITMTLGLRDEGIRTLGLNWLFVSIANQVSNFYNIICLSSVHPSL